MKTDFSERIVTIVVVLAFGLLYWNHKQKKEDRVEKAIPTVAIPSPAPQTTKQQKTRNAASVATSTPAPPPMATATPTTNTTAESRGTVLDLCRNFSSYKFLVHKTLLKPLLTQVNGALAVPEELQKCLTEKTTVVVLNFAGFDYKNPSPYYYSTIEPRVFISTIEKDQDLKKILADSGKLRKLGFGTEASAAKFYAEIFGPESTKKKWTYIPFSVSDKNLGTVTFFAPRTHPLAKTITKENINPLISAGAMILDVRPQANFKASHIEKAVSSPTAAKKVTQTALSAEEQKNAGYVIHPNSLPKDKSTSIVVLNQNPKSFSAYNTLTQLSVMGYSNLYFYWTGMDDWDGKSIVTPEKVEGLQFITYNDLKGRFNSPNALVVDVRSAKSVKKKMLPRNVHMPFSEKKNAFKDPLYRADGLSVSAIQQHDEKFTVGMPELPASINTLVIIGDHTYDWKPLKAGLVIPHNRNIKIEVYRDGYRGWKYLSNLESPLAKKIGVAKKDLPKVGNTSSHYPGFSQQIKGAFAKGASSQTTQTADSKKAKKKDKSKSVRMTRPDGSAYPKLNAPPPTRSK